MGVSRGQYYYKTVGPNSKKIEEENAVINCFEKHNGNYGCTRIRRELLLEGIDVSEYRISKILKKHREATSREAKNSKKGLGPWGGQYYEEDLGDNKIKITMPYYPGVSNKTGFLHIAGRPCICAIIDATTRQIIEWTIEKK